MDRRTLLTSLLGGGGVVIAGALIATPGASPRYPTIEQPIDYRGFRLHWSGWKGSQHLRWLVGQWFAWPERGTPDPTYYYLNVPGMMSSRYTPGDCFNISPGGRSYVYPET